VVPFKLDLEDEFGNSFSLTFDYTVAAIDQAFSIAETTIVNDTNQDGVVSPGETGRIRIKFRNTGTSDALGVMGVLTTSHPAVTLTDADILYLGDVSGGSTACAPSNNSYTGSCGAYVEYYPAFTVPTTIPVGTVVPFKLDLEDEFGNSFSLTFDYTVAAIDQAFSIAETTIVNDTDQDGVVSPGETGRIRIKVRNTGTSDALGVTGVLTTTHPAVTLTDADMLYLGDVSGGSTACAPSNNGYTGSCGAYVEYYPAFTVPATVSVGAVIPFKLYLGDEFGNRFHLTFSHTVGS
jgi:hypothetical protein